MYISLLQVQIFRSSHNHGKASLHHYYTFQRNVEEEYTILYLVWGVLEKDTSTCNRKTSDFCSGNVVWDDSFDSSSPEAQLAIYVIMLFFFLLLFRGGECLIMYRKLPRACVIYMSGVFEMGKLHSMTKNIKMRI